MDEDAGRRRDVASPRGAPRPLKLSEIVARDIVNEITEKGLQPGDSLEPEAVMVQRLGIGRASVREALRILEVHGLIHIKAGPGGGPIVGRVEAANHGRMSALYYQMLGATFRDLAEVRLVLEPLLARQAAQVRSSEAIGRISSVVEAARRIDRTDDEDLLNVNNAFHKAILDSADNKVLALLASSVEDTFAARIRGSARERARRRKALVEHEQILQAIVEGRAADAESLMHTHLLGIDRHYEKHHAGMLRELVHWM